jgi:hypothetical protein
MAEQQHTSLILFGMDIEVDYRVEDGQVQIDKVIALGVPGIAMEDYDLTTHAQEYLQDMEDEGEDIAAAE